MSNTWTLADMAPQPGKRCMITGANSGIGFWTAVELARQGVAVMMACRDLTRGKEALARLRVEARGPHSAAEEAELIELDLASLGSVQEVAEAELGRHEPLHMLINNAGVMAPRSRQETADGYEMQFGVNVLGHFALTCRLMPALEMARGVVIEEASRVVTVSSIAHKRARLDFDDLQSERSYNPMRAYQQSKLADLMFALELERRVRAKMLGAVSIAVHPGVARTNLFKVGSSRGIARAAEKTLQFGLGVVFASDREGALPTLFAATAVEAKGGCYYGPQGFLEMRGGDVGPAKVMPQATDREAQKRLWDVCAELTGVDL